MITIALNIQIAYSFMCYFLFLFLALKLITTAKLRLYWSPFLFTFHVYFCDLNILDLDHILWAAG